VEKDQHGRDTVTNLRPERCDALALRKHDVGASPPLRGARRLGESEMTLEERIPEMSSTELANLHANATRLQQAGTAKQQTDAATLLPLVDAEMTRRRELAAAAARPRRSTLKRKSPA
jgi:hypothetical protein